MSTALLRRELKSELEELDQRHNSDKKNTSNNRRVQQSIKRSKKYKPNFKVDEIEKELNISKEDQREKSKKKLKETVDNLLKLSSKTSSSSEISVEPLLEQHFKTKRHFEPKGRNLLKKNLGSKRRPTNSETKSVFTEKDFEDFSKEYFINSKPIKSLRKTEEEDV